MEANWMKVVFVTSFFGTTYGGAEVSMGLLARNLREKECEIQIITTRKSRFSNMNIIQIPYTSWLPKRALIFGGNRATDLFLAHNMLKCIEDLNPDILHVQDTYVLPAAILIARRLRLPVIVTVRNNVLDGVLDLIFPFPISEAVKIRNRTIIMALNQTNAIISVSEYIKKELVSVNISSRNIYPIYNLIPPWNIENNRKSSDSSTVVLFAPCRLAREKGIDVLIRAINKVVERNKDLKLIIAGDGPERKPLEKLTQKLGLTNFVRFLGKIPNKHMLSLYLSSDIVLSLSIHPECFSRVILETIFVGRAIIATNTGGNPEAVIHGFNGLLVPPNDIEETSSAILSLIDNDKLRRSMGKNGKRLAKEKFDPDRLVSKTMELYNVVGRKSRT